MKELRFQMPIKFTQNAPPQKIAKVTDIFPLIIALVESSRVCNPLCLLQVHLQTNVPEQSTHAHCEGAAFCIFFTLVLKQKNLTLN